MSRKQLKLGAFMRPVSIHTAAWRFPGGTPDANFNLEALVSYAQKLEAGLFDAFFMADHLAVLNMPMDALKRSATNTSFDPLTLLPALAMKTERLGLIATASTTFEPPYMIARRFASLDHISKGRAGWNIVTTSNPDAAKNFGQDEQMDHADRYRRALYTYWRRTSPYPSFMTFDSPSREVCSPRRVATNTPLQALVTLNDPVYVELSEHLAANFIGG